jgi:hypothetical protein
LRRRIFILAALALAACQTSNPYIDSTATQRFLPVNNAAALMAIVRGRTVEYTNQSNRGDGIRQTFASNGTTVYGNQRRVWSVVDGRYCSSSDLTSSPDTWECFRVDVNEAGTLIRWMRFEGANQISAPDGEVDTWYGRIL